MCKCGAVQEGYFKPISYELESLDKTWNNTDTNVFLCATIIEKVKCCCCQEEDIIFHYMKEQEF